VVALLLSLVLAAAAGCGGDDGKSSKAGSPSKAALSCRAEWKDLRAEVEGRSSKTNPSALAPRWNAVAATAEYYATSASGSDCGTRMDGQRKSIAALTAFSAKLTRYDMQQRLGEVKAGAEKYAAGPRPPAPKPSPAATGKKGGKNGGKKKAHQKPPPRAPKPADVGAALKTLTQQAPVATREQGPGWEQARVVDLTDSTAVAKAVKDLDFLSSESAAYRACSAALAQITAALAAS
jgi:hypothetical protein